jgi:hypothetical protein
MGRDTRATWAKRVERWRGSGLTAEEFAAKWKLGQTERRDRTPAKRVEFVVVPAPRTVAVVTVPADAIEVVLGSGVVMRVPPQFDVDGLRGTRRACGRPTR